MNKTMDKKKLNDIEKIKNFLIRLGFVCSSYQSAQNLIYSKNGETVIIKNSKSKKRV
jgi:hypothetical protein